MPTPDEALGAAVSEMANALQVAAPLVSRLRRDLSAHVHDVVTLEAAIDRAVRALKRMHPQADE